MFDELIDTMDDVVLETLSATDTTMDYAPSVGDPVLGVACLYNDASGVQSPMAMSAEHPQPMVWFKIADVAPHDPMTDNPTITIQTPLGAKVYRVRARPTDGQVGGSSQLKLQLQP